MLGFPTIVQVIKLVLDVGLPSNIIVSNGDICRSYACFFIRVPKLESIVKVTLGDKATWEGWSTWFKWGAVNGFTLTQVCVRDDRVTVAELSCTKLVAHELLV